MSDGRTAVPFGGYVRVASPSDNELAPLTDVAARCLQGVVRLPWGTELIHAFVMELLVSTLSHAINEDRLIGQLATLGRENPEALELHSLAETAPRDIARWLHLHEEDRSSSGPHVLAQFVQFNLGHLHAEGRELALEMLDANSGKSLSELNAWLNTFPVFAGDPLKKKSALLLQRMWLGGYLEGARFRELPFAVDRHIIRVLLRLGWVEVTDPWLADKVARRTTLDAREDLALRSACWAAMGEVARRAGLPNAVVNYTLWQFARSYCARREPGCQRPAILGRKADLAPPDDGACWFSRHCSAFLEERVLTTLDPVHRGYFY